MLAAVVDYDAVILTRPDVKLDFDPDFNLLDYLSFLDDSIYVIDFECPGEISNYNTILNDRFFIGKKETIKKILSPTLKDYIHNTKYNFPGIDCIHYHTRKLFTTQDIEIKIINGIRSGLHRFSNC